MAGIPNIADLANATKKGKEGDNSPAKDKKTVAKPMDLAALASGKKSTSKDKEEKQPAKKGNSGFKGFGSLNTNATVSKGINIADLANASKKAKVKKTTLQELLDARKSRGGLDVHVKADLSALSIQEEEQRKGLRAFLENASKKKQQTSKDSLQKRLGREKNARKQAEELIERASRDLYLAQEETKRALKAEESAKEEIEKTLLDLNKAIMDADNAEQRRKAMLITAAVGGILYLVSEFIVEAAVEAYTQGGIGLTIAKLSLLIILVPLEIIVEKIMLSKTASDANLRHHLFKEIMVFVLADGVVTVKEQETMKLYQRHHGLPDREAGEIFEEVMKDLGHESIIVQRAGKSALVVMTGPEFTSLH